MKIPVPSASLAYRAFFYAATDRIQPREGSREISARPIDTRISSSFFRRRSSSRSGEKGCATSERRIRGNWFESGACRYLQNIFVDIWILLIRRTDLRFALVFVREKEILIILSYDLINFLFIVRFTDILLIIYS